MKIVIISSILLLFLACSETQTLTPKRYSFAEITEKLSDEYADIIADIKADRQDDLKGERTRSFANDPFYQFYATMDEYDYHRIPLYELDLETFYSAPSEENIQRCIRPTNTVNLMAIKDGEIKMRLIATKSPSGWYDSNATLDYGKAIGWLRDTLARAGTKDYKIFTVGGLEWVTYDRGGKTRYFTITGQPYTPGQFCEYCVEKYNQGQEFRKTILENPELFPDMHKQLMEEMGKSPTEQTKQ